jgi:N-methylhydantoinase A
VAAALVVGGGAGGLHAAQLAEELGITSIVVPRIASAFCAFGAVVADLRHDYSQSYVDDIANVDFASVADVLHELEARGRSALTDEGSDEGKVTIVRSLELRYKDQVYECTIDGADLNLRGDPATVRATIEARFYRRHQELYDYSQPGYPCELVSVIVTVVGASPRLQSHANGDEAPETYDEPSSVRWVQFTRAAEPVETPVFTGHGRFRHRPVDGPAIIEEPNTTIVVPLGWRVTFHQGEQAYLIDRRGREETVSAE